MSSADVGQYANGRFDNILQGTHLSHLRNSSFENSEFGLLVHLPNGQRHADLRIIAAW